MLLQYPQADAHLRPLHMLFCLACPSPSIHTTPHYLTSFRSLLNCSPTSPPDTKSEMIHLLWSLQSSQQYQTPFSSLSFPPAPIIK